MSQIQVKDSGENLMVVLPPEVIASIGLKAGDTLEVSVVEQSLVLRSVEEVERAKRADESIDKIFQRRRVVLDALAEGAR